MHRLHSISAHAIVIAAWLTFWWTMPISAVRGMRNRTLWRTILEVSLAFAVFVFVLLSSFTGYLNRLWRDSRGILKISRVTYDRGADSRNRCRAPFLRRDGKGSSRVRRAHAKVGASLV